MTNKPQHTATPYNVCVHKEGMFDRKFIEINASGRAIADVPYFKATKEQSLANAEFIVKAVNNHDALVEALKYVLDQAGLSNNSPSYIKIQTALAQVEKG